MLKIFRPLLAVPCVPMASLSGSQSETGDPRALERRMEEASRRLDDLNARIAGTTGTAKTLLRDLLSKRRR